MISGNEEKIELAEGQLADLQYQLEQVAENIEIITEEIEECQGQENPSEATLQKLANSLTKMETRKIALHLRIVSTESRLQTLKTETIPPAPQNPPLPPEKSVVPNPEPNVRPNSTPPKRRLRVI